MLKILIPVDGSNYSKRALEEAIKIATLTDAELTLLHVRSEHVPKVDSTSKDFEPQYNERSRKDSLDLLEDMVEHLSDEDKEKIERISMVGSVHDMGKTSDIAVTITDFVEKEGIDLVIVGSQGVNAGRIRSVFMGSVTKDVLAHTNCPVLVVK